VASEAQAIEAKATNEARVRQIDFIDENSKQQRRWVCPAGTCVGIRLRKTDARNTDAIREADADESSIIPCPQRKRKRLGARSREVMQQKLGARK